MCRVWIRGGKTGAAVGLAALGFFLGAAGTTAAQTCNHPAGAITIDLLGDVNGSGNRNVADALCAVLCALAESAGQPLSGVSCLAGDGPLADVSCDGTVDVTDVQTIIYLALGHGVPSALDPDSNGCPGACAPCNDPSELSCLIEGACVPEAQRAGADLCQICSPDLNPAAWTVELASTYFRDDDEDTYGLPSDSLALCAPVGAYTTTTGDDCNDSDAAIKPGGVETCDDVDNNCDGATDEVYLNLGDACDGVDIDECANGTYTCTLDGTDVECVNETEEDIADVCDGVDNDCDGNTDEDFPDFGEICDGVDIDECSNGTYTCTLDGTDVECVNETEEDIAEQCNDVDDDCDGVTDEDFVLGANLCDSDADSDSCDDDTLVCSSGGGGTECEDAGGSIGETCGNGDDDDCNGLVDDGCGPLPAPLPSTVSDLRAWYRADSLSLADGATLTGWSDESPSGFHLSDVVGTPSFYGNVVNGLPVIRFNGASGLRTVPIVLQGGTNDFTIYLVVHSGPTQNSLADLYDNTHGAQQAGPAMQQNFSNVNEFSTVWWDGSAYTGTTPINIGSSAFRIVETIKSGASVQNYLDGSLATTNTLPELLAQPPVALHVGFGSTPGRTWHGDMAEFVYFNRALSAAEQLQVRNYLDRKYAITVSDSIPRNCQEILIENPLAVDGPYYIDPDGAGGAVPFAAYCNMTMEAGGWTLVRRREQSTTWHPVNDNAKGTSAYGTYVPDPQANSTFSLAYSSFGYSEMMFATGDLAKWVRTDREEIDFGASVSGCDSASVVNASHLSATPYVADWCMRPGALEDPWVTALNHSDIASGEYVVYGENSYAAHEQYLSTRNGANVWVRGFAGSSCADILERSPSAASGTYWIDTDGPGGAAPNQVYCDMTSDGGGWTQVVRLDTNDAATREYYDTAFWDAASELGTPTGTGDHRSPTFDSLAFNAIRLQYNYQGGGTVSAVYLRADAAATLRQNVNLPLTNENPAWQLVAISGSPAEQFFGSELRFSTVGNGNDYSRIWYNLLDRNACNQGGSIGHRGDAGSNNWLWEVARGSDLDPTGCQHNDYHLGLGANYDRKVWGQTDIAPAAFYSEGVMRIYVQQVDVTGAAALPVGRSCEHARANGNPGGDGLYWIDPDGAGGNPAFQAYCDMTTDGGGWTLVGSYPKTAGIHAVPGWYSPAQVGINFTDGATYWKLSDAVMNSLKTTHWRGDVEYEDCNGGPCNGSESVYWSGSCSIAIGATGSGGAADNCAKGFTNYALTTALPAGSSTHAGGLCYTAAASGTIIGCFAHPGNHTFTGPTAGLTLEHAYTGRAGEKAGWHLYVK